MKKIINYLAGVMICGFIMSTSAFASTSTNVVINSKVVKFTESTGYPFVDQNNRTMVPLRITMESAGTSVGFDSSKSTAIIITEHGRIEVPIGTDTIYYNNKKIKNDTNSVLHNGHVYLPIRAVLEAAGFTMEWDPKTNTVTAYTFKYDPNEFVPYSTSSLSTLTDNVLNGNVVYIKGNYYATPAYVKSLINTTVHYSGSDLNTAVYPQADRYALADLNESDIKWITNNNFGKVMVREDQLDSGTNYLNDSNIPGYVYVYGFYESGLMNIELIYIVDEMTEEFMNAPNATGTFNGIKMKKENGILFFDYNDLRSKQLI